MATRLYYVANTAPPVSPPFDPAWTSAANAARRMMSLAKSPTTESFGPFAIGAVGPAYSLAVQLVSPPMAAQTLSGTFSAVSRGREVQFNDDVNKRAVSVRVYAADGATLRGEPLPFTPTASTTELFQASGFMSGQSHADAAALTPLAVVDGDRLVITLGYGVLTSGVTPQYEMTIGGANTDHANADIDTTGTVPWAEFSANIVWAQSATTLVPAFGVFSAVAPLVSNTMALTPASAAFTAGQVVAIPLKPVPVMYGNDRHAARIEGP